MNKFFEFHLGKRRSKDGRPYHKGTWEPIRIEPFRLLPFQLSTISPSDYTIYHVQDGSKTDITSYMNAVTFSGTYIYYKGAILNDILPNGRCHFELINSTDYTYYTDDCEVGTIYDWLTGWTAVSGTGTISGKNVTVMTSDYVVKTNTFDLRKTDVLTLIFKKLGGTGNLTVTLYNSADVSQGNLSGSSIGNLMTYSITAPRVLEGCYVQMSAAADTHTMSDFDMYLGYSRDWIKYIVNSAVDFGTVKYTTFSWTQHIWKLANVRRSPRVEVTQIGDERNGEFIPEKRTSAVRYVVRMKCTEQEFEAFAHSMSGDVTITDQTGYTFTCKNMEISDPSWYYANGVLEISFINSSNVNTWTLNNSAL